MLSVPNGRQKNPSNAFMSHESSKSKLYDKQIRNFLQSWLLKQVSFCQVDFIFSWHLSTRKHAPGRLCKFLRPTFYKNLWQPQIGNQDWIIASFLHSLSFYCSFVESFLFIVFLCICLSCVISFQNLQNLKTGFGRFLHALFHHIVFAQLKTENWKI